MKNLVLLASITLAFSSFANAGNCPTGSSRSVDAMNAAMVSVFTTVAYDEITNSNGRIWFQPNGHPYSNGNYYRIKLTNSSGAKYATFVTDYRKPNGRRFTETGGKRTRRIEITKKKSGYYEGWLVLLGDGGVKGKAKRGIKKHGYTDDVAQVRADGAAIKMSKVFFRKRGGNCELVTVTDPRYKGTSVLKTYNWAMELENLKK